MALLPRKGLLAIAAVVDVALQPAGRPISAKSVAARHGLPPRYLESVLQALVRDGILKSIRGPRGGYELAREPRQVAVADILDVAGTIEENDARLAGSALLREVVIPALADAAHEFAKALGGIQLEDLARRAKNLTAPSGEPAASR